MNFWSIVSIVILGVVHVTGLAAIIICAKWAPKGYADGDGFHLGAEPVAQPRSAPRRGDPAENEPEFGLNQAA
jgi:hypothetical protein